MEEVFTQEMSRLRYSNDFLFLGLHWKMLQSDPITCRRQSRNLENEELLIVGEDQVQKYVRNPKVHRT